MTTPDAQRPFEEMMPEPAAHRYMSHGHSSRWQLAGRAVPPDADPLYTADQLRTAMQAVWDAATERAAKVCEGIAESEQAMHNTQAEQAADACATAIRSSGRGT